MWFCMHTRCLMKYKKILETEAVKVLSLFAKQMGPSTGTVEHAHRFPPILGR